MRYRFEDPPEFCGAKTRKGTPLAESFTESFGAPRHSPLMARVLPGVSACGYGGARGLSSFEAA